MEFGVAEVLPNYSGGLGVLAGDHLKSASDLGVPLIGVTTAGIGFGVTVNVAVPFEATSADAGVTV